MTGNLSFGVVPSSLIRTLRARRDGARTMCLEFSCKRAQSRTCSGYAERSRKSRRRGTTERSDGNRGRSPRIVVTEPMCLEFSCKRAQSRTCSGYAECSRKSRRSGSTPQDMPQASPLLALVQIRATDPVAIYPLQLFVSIRAIRGQKKSQ